LTRSVLSAELLINQQKRGNRSHFIKRFTISKTKQNNCNRKYN